VRELKMWIFFNAQHGENSPVGEHSGRRFRYAPQSLSSFRGRPSAASAAA